MACAGAPHRADIAGTDIDTERGPLDRLFGLANVTVTTASSAGAVRIVALDVDVADRVVAQLTDIAAIGAEDAT